MRREFRMPDAGEGLTEAEVLGWRVAPGDVVAINQVLVEIETAKAAVELPSPYAGTVVELLAQPGQVVAVGAPIIAIDDTSGEPSPSDQGDAAGGAAPAAGHAPGAAPAAGGPSPSDREDAAAQPGTGARQPVLVGYGVRDLGEPRRRQRLTPHGVEHPEPGPPGTPARPMRHGGLEQARAVEGRLADARPLAKPPVRRLARDLGVDLADVVPTGPRGSITHEDVARAAQRASLAASQPLPAAAPGPAPTAPRPDDEVERVPLSHVARMMSRAMSESAFSAPHVTEWVDVDVSASMRLIRATRARSDWSRLTITPLTLAALGLVRAARANPRVNASLEGDDLLVHRHVHLGVAVDSPRGLVVPHVPRAEELDLAGMAEALSDLVATARAGRSRPEQLRGSTITITNVGVFGVDGGTPILNPGESAILALGRVLARPWVVDGALAVREVATLALSFDHRVVDGGLGSRVLRSVADFLEDPGTALALG